MNYPASHILRVVEENIDGCGSDAVMYVEFSRMLSAEIMEKFQSCLQAAKNRPNACDDDTEDMVKDAVVTFNNSVFAKVRCVHAEICDVPYFGVVTF